MLAVPFDPEHLETSGDPLPVLQGVDTDTFGGAAFDISPDGTLAYVPAQQALKKSLVWVDRSGGIEELLPEPKSYLGQSLSPDGERVAVSLRDENGDQIWVYEIERGVLSRFTFEGSNYNPHWSPDGKSILFSSHRDGLPGNLFVKPLDGSTPPERLTSNDFITVPLSWTNDDVILFETIRDRTGRDISFLKLSDPTQAQPLLETAYSEHPASLSPDSEWLVYASDETGRSEVYVRRFPNRGDKRQVSTGGGTQPVWARDGSEIFYRSGDRMMSVPITVDSEIRLGTSVTLFEGSFDPGEWGWVNYDVSRDGQRFAMLQPVVTTEPDEIVIVLNWFEELKRLVPPK